MALINCPECNKEISTKAMSCPNCGYTLVEPVVQPVVQKSERSGCSLFFLIVGAIIFAFILMYLGI